MQDLSYSPQDPVFEAYGYRFTVQLFTYENVYGLDGSRTTCIKTGNITTITCTGLTWAGQQERCDGAVRIRVTSDDSGAARFSISAEHTKMLRCVKLRLHGLPRGPIVSLRETDERHIDEGGIILRYPNGWHHLQTAMVVMRARSSQDFLYFRSLDDEVREKRFAFIPCCDQVDVELIFEGAATQPSASMEVPDWEVGRVESPETAFMKHDEFTAKAFGLVRWEERSDVPQWARKIALVAAIHCEHFTGYVFNDYDAVLRTIEWLAERIDPQHILAYLPGWEGRYYWQYGYYRPEPRLGGEEGFERLMKGARSLGVHVMPMFGITHANCATEGFEQWGAPGVLMTAGGKGHGGSCDWDGSRHYDHGWGAPLNPGSPTWQARLASQIEHLMDRYLFDAVFLDISAVWYNDPRFPVFRGVSDLVKRIRSGRPDVLVAGEGWYDAIGSVTPLVQSGHLHHILNYHDEPWAPFFDKYNRCFGHLCLGDPSRGSTGVHEWGTNLPCTRVPLRKGIIPTVTIVDDTLRTAQDAVEDIVADAKEYVRKFIATDR
jgi:hypothetical protein